MTAILQSSDSLIPISAEQALKEHAVVEHPEFGKIYAYELDGFGSCFLMDDANVPSLLTMTMRSVSAYVS